MKADGWLLLCMGVAKELHMSLARLMHEVTEEELLLWSAYFGVMNEKQEQIMKSAKRRR